MNDDSTAPIIPIGAKQYFCVEYPGYVKRLNRAIETLGGERALSDALSNNQSVTLKFRPRDPFSHPINSDTITCAKLLVKVTRRVQRDKATGEVIKEDTKGYRIDIMGKVYKTVRFRAMADFQYLVPKTDKIRQLKIALAQGNVDQLMKYEPATDDDDMDNLRIIPPPYFSVLEMPFSYNYRQSAPVIRVRVKQPDGTYKINLINRQKRHDLKLTTIYYEDESVPTRSFYNLKELTLPEDIELSRRIKELFEKRPIWTLFALRCELQTDIKLSRLLAYQAYTFRNGAWRDCWIKYGVDPRSDPKYHIYQMLDIRRYLPQNEANSSRPLASIHKPRITDFQTPEMLTKQAESKDSTNKPIIPGKEDYKLTSTSKPGATNYLLVCDIVDPEFVPFLNNPRYLKPEPTKDSGFYYSCVFTRFRKSVRRKYFQALEKGYAEPLGNVTDGLEVQIRQEEEKAAAATVGSSSSAASGSRLQTLMKEEEAAEENESITSDTVEEAARQALSAMSRTVFGHRPSLQKGGDKGNSSAASLSPVSDDFKTSGGSTGAAGKTSKTSAVNTSLITNKRLKDVVDDYMSELENITDYEEVEDDEDGEEVVTVVDEVPADEDDEEMGMGGYEEDLLDDEEDEETPIATSAEKS